MASAATRLFVGAQAMVAPVGFAMSVSYVKRALEQVGVEPEVYARGKYKSAGEQLVRDSMSGAQREQLDAVLDAFYREVVAAVAKGRKLEPDRVRELMDGAPYRAEDAVALGLVDGTAYEDEIPALIAKSGTPPRGVEAARYLAAIRATHFCPVRARPCIGVVTVHGAIVSESTFGQTAATGERVIAAVRLARTDPRIRAVVLHVGGDAQPLAQELGQRNAIPTGQIWRREDQPFVGNERAADRHARTTDRSMFGQQGLGVRQEISHHSLRAALGLRGELRAGDDLTGRRADNDGRLGAPDVKTEDAVCRIHTV